MGGEVDLFTFLQELSTQPEMYPVLSDQRISGMPVPRLHEAAHHRRRR